MKRVRVLSRVETGTPFTAQYIAFRMRFASLKLPKMLIFLHMETLDYVVKVKNRMQNRRSFIQK